MRRKSTKMCTKSYSLASATCSGQGLPKQPRSKSKRTLIKSACTACQKRKSRCDGHRPVCSRCQALQTDCKYNAEKDESRWSALRRKNQKLEKERDDARNIVTLLQSQPEPEALEIYRRVRKSVHGGDLGALVCELRDSIGAGSWLQQQHEHFEHHQHVFQPPEPAIPQKQPQKQQQYQQPQGVKPGPIYTITGPVHQLPSLRSVVEVSQTSSRDSISQPLVQLYPPAQLLQQRSILALGCPQAWNRH